MVSHTHIALHTYSVLVGTVSSPEGEHEQLKQLCIHLFSVGSYYQIWPFYTPANKSGLQLTSMVCKRTAQKPVNKAYRKQWYSTGHR